MRTSYSALDTFKVCPQKYKYQEIDKLKAPKKVEAVFGTLIHSALKYMFERNPLYPTEDEVVDFFSKSFLEKIPKLAWSNDEEKERSEKAYLKEGVQMLRSFYKKNQPWASNAVELESRFSIEIEDDRSKEKHSLVGIIDRIDKNDENYEIIDYKTGKKMPSEDSLVNNLQLSLYFLALVNRWPNIAPEKFKTSLYFLKHNEKISIVPGIKKIEETKKEILGTIREIEERKVSGDFPPRPGPLCDWCGFRKICPMWRHEYKKPETPSDEELASLIEEYLVIKESEDKDKNRLKEIRSKLLLKMNTEKLGRVFGNNGYITKTEIERISFDEDEVKKILQEEKLWDEVSEIDISKLSTIIPKLPETIREKISALKKKSISVVLKASRKK